ncbi:ChrR family anti-sigma-E factor [Oryzifoliimicrobium ureilyticus]|uniref:ChrR family anti-sigma-E factor n=1 Tax=Oryzifoliimicrobium ureilyticus TaxID=3113724 RepID=UPI00307646F8
MQKASLKGRESSETILHHLDDDILLSYAAGTLEEGWSIAVATHLSLCPACRSRLETFESLGGVLLEEEQKTPEVRSDAHWAELMQRIEAGEVDDVVAFRRQPSRDPLLPEPLYSYVERAGGLKWRNFGFGAAQMIVPTDDPTTTVRLLKIPAGRPVPEHTHTGTELTLVLDGSFSDEVSAFRRGDIEIADGNLMHTPKADPGRDCICLAVTDAPLKFSSRFMKFLQRFLKI